jgi:hypothetical protein
MQPPSMQDQQIASMYSLLEGETLFTIGLKPGGSVHLLSDTITKIILLLTSQIQTWSSSVFRCHSHPYFLTRTLSSSISFNYWNVHFVRARPMMHSKNSGKRSLSNWL